MFSYSRVEISNKEFFIRPVTQKCGTITQKNTDLNWITAKTLNLTCCTTFWFLDTWFMCTRATQTHIGNLQLKFCILDCHYCMQVINFLFQSSLPIQKYPWHPILEESESCKIWVSYSNVDDDRSRMRRYAMSTGKWFTSLKELPTSWHSVTSQKTCIFNPNIAMVLILVLHNTHNMPCDFFFSPDCSVVYITWLNKAYCTTLTLCWWNGFLYCTTSCQCNQQPHKTWNQLSLLSLSFSSCL